MNKAEFIIKQCGGRAGARNISGWTGLKIQSIYSWRTQGFVPSKHIRRVWEQASLAGYFLQLEDFV